MEIELKYSIEDEQIIGAVMEDYMLASSEKKGSRETLAMRAVYFDTDKGDLRNHGIAFRIRLEGCEYIATVKRGNKSEEGLHKREEVNIPVTDDDFIEYPDISAFAENAIIADIYDEIKDKTLMPVMEMNFVREKFKVDYEDSVMEVSLDQGDIITAGGSCPICEMEIELYSGNESDLINLGDIIQKTYELKPENISKYARGLMLIANK